ncbi:MAG: phosphatase PAP2 family protein [Acidobacteriota bacterium]|nr:phosphatase PAP2 family protein [Acidobacteriota bacterium]
MSTRCERILPHGGLDLLRQLSLFALAYAGYEIVRGVVGSGGGRPFADATRIIDVERALHVFVEPNVQHWVTTRAGWLLDVADWTYLNAHFALSAGALAFIYLRRNDSFYFVRNMFMVAMLIALVGYCLYPTAPPRLMPQWGFTDSIQQFTGIDAQQGTSGLLLNPYAAVPSMHVCVALMIGLPMSRLVHGGAARLLWRLYPAFIAFVVIATANHYFTDVVLGALTAAVSALLAERLLARARPDAWAFSGVPGKQVDWAS